MFRSIFDHPQGDIFSLTPVTTKSNQLNGNKFKPGTKTVIRTRTKLCHRKEPEPIHGRTNNRY